MDLRTSRVQTTGETINLKPAQSQLHTRLLIVLLVLCAIGCGVAWSWLSTSRDRAIASRQDRDLCIAQLVQIQSGDTSASANGGTEDRAINRRLRAAAVAANLGDQLASIDPGLPARVGETDFVRTPIYLRLNAVSLKQLTGFLYELSLTDDMLRTTDVELTLPLTQPVNRTDVGDLWTADITLSLASYQQQQPTESR